jgi:hypothetical protein
VVTFKLCVAILFLRRENIDESAMFIEIILDLAEAFCHFTAEILPVKLS